MCVVKFTSTADIS